MVSHFEGNIKYIKSEIRVGCIAKHKILAPQLMANKKFGLAFILSHFLKKMYYPSMQLSRCAHGQRDQRDDCVDMAYNFFSFKT